MTKNNVESTALRPPHQRKSGIPLAPKLVFMATLSLQVASMQVAATPAVELPSAPGLDIEFRCTEGGEGGSSCPLDVNDQIGFGGAAKYLDFEGGEGGEGACFFSPALTEGVDGIGFECRLNGDRIASDEFVRIDVFDADGGEGGEGGEGGVASSTAMEGIYLNGLTSFAGDGCIADTAGTLLVELETGPPLNIGWSSDDTPGGGGGCAEPGPHAIFVDFGGTRDVTAIEVSVNFGPGVYAAGIELADVSPDTCSGVGSNNTDCEIELVEEPVTGGDLRAIIADPGLIGSIGVSEGFPIRVRDDRDACQWNATAGDIVEPLVFDGSSYSVNGGALEPLTLVVSDNSTTTGVDDYFTISAKGCGVLRLNGSGPNYLGDPVPRGTAGADSFFDIIAIESDITPVAGVLGFESDGLNASPYKCEPLIADRDLDQPFLEINARPDETKYLAGVPPNGSPGIIDPVGRDIMVGCGSKRGSSKSFSYVAWNLTHALATDMYAEIDAELAVLEDTVATALRCVDPAFASRQLRWPRYIRRSYDGQAFASAAMLVDRFKYSLEQPGVSAGFADCYASGANLDEVIDSGGAPGPGDVPLNAFGDIISQLEHLSYALRSFEAELTASAPPP
jgi:hypothetical protein